MACPTFLQVHVLNTTFGRRKGDKKVLCNGEKDVVELMYGDCLTTNLLASTWQTCRGLSSCEVPAEPTPGLTWPEGECSSTATKRRNELNVTFLCVECSDWAAFAGSPGCLDAALLATDWADTEEVASLADVDKKSLLVSSLSRALSPSGHSLAELSQRPVEGEQGGLCGLAALYQALADTLLSPGQLAMMDYTGMRKYVGQVMLGYPQAFSNRNQQKHLIPSNVKAFSDQDLVKKFQKGV